MKSQITSASLVLLCCDIRDRFLPFFLLFFILFTGMPFPTSHALENSEISEKKEDSLNLYSIFTEIPQTSKTTFQESFSHEAALVWGGIVASTLVTYHYDQVILNNIQNYGREIGIGNQENTKTIIRSGPYPLLRLPSDTGSSLYFLGDGWIHMGTAAGFLATGYFTHFSRPWNTAIELIHGMVVSTVFSQALKRTTGRESPSERTVDRGAWRPFPRISDYGQHTSRYDAFPSGHIMTATLTFTVIGENYPEHLYWLRPLEYTWLTLLGLQMINNGVHWASDYPLGIAMGYKIGKISSRMSKKIKNDSETVSSDKSSGWDRAILFPSQVDDVPTLNVLYSF